MATPKKHESLAKHPGIWRLDAVGTLHSRTKNQIRFKALFTRIKEDALSQPYRNLAIEKIDGKDHHLAVSFYSGALSRYIVGSIWNDGERISNTIGMPKHIQIDTRNIRYQRLGEIFKAGQHQTVQLLNDEIYDFGEHTDEVKNTWVAVAKVLNPVDNTKYVIIPTSELFRFYLGGSSLLCRHSLLNDLNRICEGIKEASGQDKIVLSPKRRLHKIENFVLFRACSNRQAYEALMHPQKRLAHITTKNKLLEKEAQKEPLTLSARFPFFGITTLTVRGYSTILPDVTKAGSGVPAFYAMNIVHCTHPVQLVDPILNLDAIRSAESGKGGKSKPQNNRPLDRSKQHEDDNKVTEQPANKNLKRARALNFHNPFGAMRNLSFRFIYNESEKETSRTANFSDVNPNKLSYGDGEYGKQFTPNRGIDDSSIDREVKARSMNDFVDMLNILKNLVVKEGCSLSTITLDDEILLGNILLTQIPNLPTNYSRIRWHKLDDEPGNRSVCIVDIQTSENEHVYLLEIELKASQSGFSTALICEKDLNQLNQEFFRQYLASTSAYNGWPTYTKNVKEEYAQDASKLLDKIDFKRITHQSLKDVIEGNQESMEERKKLILKWASDINSEIIGVKNRLVT